MSLNLVGKDLLPNVYIKNIDIHDYSNNKLSAHVDVCVLDADPFNAGRDYYWSDKDLLPKHMKLLFVVSENSDMTSALTNSNVAFSEAEIKGSEQYDSKTVHLQSRNVSQSKSFVNQGIKYYNQRFTFIFSKSSSNVTIFCANIIDSRNLSHQYGLDLFNNQVRIYNGPICSETIVSNSNLNLKTNIFIRPDGSQHIGPVHSHAGGYMEGSIHSNAPHSSLTRLEIFNYKIKDYRKINLEAKKIESLYMKQKTKIYFTKLYDSFSYPDQSVNGFFGINIYNIILNKTLYGESLYNLSPSLLNLVYNSFLFKKFDIQRQKVKRSKIGFNIIQKENIVTSFDSKASGLFPFTKFQSNTIKNVVLEGLPSQANNKITQRNVTYIEEWSKEKTISHVRQSYLTAESLQQNVRYYEFEDTKLKPNKPGFYRYKFSCSFSDPSVIVVNSMLNELSSALSSLKTYYDLMSLRSNFDRNLNKTTEKFMALMRSQFEGQYERSPFIRAPNIFLKYKEYLYNMSSGQKSAILNSIKSRVDPKFASLKSVMSFLEEFRFLYFEMLQYFNFDTSKIKTMTTTSFVLKTENQNKPIDLEHTFDEIIQPSNNKAHYNVMRIRNGSGLLKISPSSLINRIKGESDKFDGLLPLEQVEDLSFTPSNFAKANVRVDLSNIAKMDISALNNHFSNVPSLGEVDVTSEEPSQDDLGISTSDIVGFKSIEDSFLTNLNSSNLNADPSRNKLTPTPVGLSLGELSKPNPAMLSSNYIQTIMISEKECEEGTSTIDQIGNLGSDETNMQELLTSLHIDSTKYFGEESKFTNFTAKKEYCSSPRKIFDKILGERVSTAALLPQRHSTQFDLNSTRSYINNPNGATAPIERADFLPTQIAAVFTNPDFAFEKVTKAIGNLAFEINYLNIFRVQYLREYASEGPAVFLDRPIWVSLKQQDLTNATKPMLCRMVYYVNGQIDIDGSQITKLPFSNKYFIVSPGGTVSVPPQPSPENLNPILYSEVSSFLRNSIYMIDHARSNIMVQNNVTNRIQTVPSPLQAGVALANTTVTTTSPVDPAVSPSLTITDRVPTTATQGTVATTGTGIGSPGGGMGGGTGGGGMGGTGGGGGSY